MLNYLKKFTLEILPSLAATVLGAYIVNHYITNSTSKTADQIPVAAVSSPEVKGAEGRPADTSTDPANAPAPGVTAKGISERAMLENRAAEKPTEVRPSDVHVIDLNQKGDRPAETAGTAAEPRRNPSAPREKDKAIAKAAPAAATPSTEAAAAPDANDLARAAIERLRANVDHASRPPEASRVADAPRAPETPRVVTVQPVARPLPPPITVGTPTEGADAAAPTPPYTASIPPADPNRPVPPADIPPPRPLAGLRNEAANAVSRTKTVTEDVFTAAKSMFHAVMPGHDHDADQSNAGQQQLTD